MDPGPCQTSGEVPERGGGKVEESCSGVNLDPSLWFILELFVSFFRSTSAAQSVGTGRTQQTSPDVCICMQIQGGGGGRGVLLNPI